MSATHDKIRKLLNMTVENGCSEDEQETALRMAMGLALKNGIEIDSLRAKDAAPIKAILKRRYDELKPHQALAAQTAAILYGIEANVYNLGAQGFSFVGRADLIELAEETMFYLFRQVESLYKASLPKGMSKRDRAEFRKTFKAACALRTLERAQQLIDDIKRNDATAQSAVGQNALVVANHFDVIKGEIEEFWEARFAKSRAMREAWRLANPQLAEAEDKRAEKEAKKPYRAPRERSIPMGNGTHAGTLAGDQVELQRRVK